MSVAPETQSPARSKTARYVNQTLQNRMLLVVLAMVVLVPILASPANYQAQELATHTTRIMAGLLAGVLVLRARVATRKEEVLAFLGTGANSAVLLYFFISVIGLFIAPPVAIRIALGEFFRILTGVLLYFALAYHVTRSEHLTKILDALVMVAGLMSMLGLVDLSRNTQQVFNATTFGDHQLFGAFLMILFPVTILAALTEKELRRQVIARVVAALTGICLIMTGTRTAWVGAIVEIFALGAFSLIPSKNRKREAVDARQYVIPVLIVLACMVVFVAMGGAGAIGNRFSLESRNAAMAYRYRMWHGAEELIKRRPLEGHGLGSYPVLQEQYTGYGRPAEKVISTFPSLGEMAHNFWYQTAAEQGLIGVAAFAAILITFLTAGVRRLRFLETGIRRHLLLASMAGVVGFAVDAIANPAWQFVQVSLFLWLMLGLGVACIRPRHGR
ncbi:MAG: O-antigen ligase family protein [Chloroherpetonaceae bacterium]|nr:O-antigen ligase family protein [Chthonomonadaceae bacterium]MDW8206675.1 O-antigen ligase family protein [Chloroherpetonaceae bacterium]